MHLRWLLALTLLCFIVDKTHCATRLSLRQRFKATDLVYNLANSSASESGDGGTKPNISITKLLCLRQSEIKYQSNSINLLN